MIWSKPGLPNFDMVGTTSAKFGPHAGNTKLYIYKHIDIAAD